MALSYLYIIQKLLDYGDDDWEIVWAGTQKWKATEYLKEKVVNGEPLAEFLITRIKDGQPTTLVEVDVYEFMNIDLGEQF